jgi:adenylate cyclase
LATVTLFDWLVDGAPGVFDLAEVLGGVCDRLRTDGVPIMRSFVFVRALHPEALGRWFVWRATDPQVRSGSLAHALQREFFANSPLELVAKTNAELRQRLDGSAPLFSMVLDEIRRNGGTDYFAVPLRFLDGVVHAITFATDRPGGFSSDDLTLLRRIGPPLARIVEIRASQRTAINLLDAYVGHRAGARILAGQVRRGDVERVRCAIWFSDLRGYTALSGRHTPEEMIAILNRVFDCQVPAVVDRGGEVLKFIGDGMLAIFPIAEDAQAGPICEAALHAAEAAQTAMGALDPTASDGPLSIGIGLHLGEVAYGNIGGGTRIDFTCIGPAVNLAARVEGLTSRLGKAILVSHDFAIACPTPTVTLGAQAVKGVAEPIEIHEPA